MTQGKTVWRRRALKVFVGFLALLVVAGLAAGLFPREILTVDSGPVKADVLVVLGGGGVERPARALELFKEGEAPKILVSGAGDSGWIKRFLERNGVTQTAILVESRSSSTRENARFSIPLLRKMGAKRVILVTSWYHSRRALMCFEHYASDMKFYSQPAPFVHSESKFQQKHVRNEIRAEYMKLVGYWLYYGVCPI
jgi:uncharacterized SAM-binding protein YcdF (DUF218 family)